MFDFLLQLKLLIFFNWPKASSIRDRGTGGGGGGGGGSRGG
jgi:hypothetical protein